MPSTKCEGLSYPTHFLKSRGSVIRNNFLEYRTKQATLLRDEIICMHCSLQITKHIFNTHFSCSFSDIIYSKSIKKNRKKVPFLKVCHFSISQHFPNVKVVVVQAVIA